MAEFASKGVATAGLTTGIIGTAGWLLNGGLGNLLGGLGGNNAALVGAMACSDNQPVSRYEMKMENELAAERQERNNFNRVSNCYARNTDRTAIASVTQLRAFKELYEKGVFESLPEQLKEAAKCRVEHPTESLTELAARLNVSKSCLNHRFRKLMELYKSMEEQA